MIDNQLQMNYIDTTFLLNLVKVLNLDKVDSDQVNLAPKTIIKSIDKEEEEEAFFTYLI